MPVADLDEMRARYLRALLASSGTIHLLIGSEEYELPLQTIFQPLALRSGPFSFEIAKQEGQQSRPGDEDRTLGTIARNGTEALARSTLRRMVVLGGPGMGKTTLLKVLLQRAIDDALTDYAAPLPLFISLPDLARSGQTLEAYLPAVLTGLHIDPGYSDALMAAVNEGRAFLCLDSLDEVGPALRPDMIALINREVPRCGGTWIIGSRFTEYKGGQFAHGQFTEWELQPLDEEMGLQLARHLLPLLAEVLGKAQVPSAENFVEALRQDRQIAAWGENPFLFSLAAMVYVQNGMLPGCRAVLYRDVVALMIAVRRPNRQARDELHTLLADVALELYQTRGRNFTIAELLEVLTGHSPGLPFPAYTALVARILDSGLLDVVAHQTYGFKHQMFQEYLAAAALASKLVNLDEHNAAWEFAWRKHTYSRWGEVLRLCVGVLVQEHGERGSQIAARWLRRLADERHTPEGDVGNLCLELALGSLREFSVVPYPGELAETARALVLAWAELLMQPGVKRTFEPCFNVRLEMLTQDIRMLDLHLVLPAIAWLEGVRDHGYEGLSADDAFRRADRTIDMLGVTVPANVLASIYPGAQGISLYAALLPSTQRGFASLERLVNLLLDRQEHWRVREGAALLLAEWGEQTPITILSEVLADTTCYYCVRIAAALALGKQQERMPVERLAALLRDDDKRVRIAIMRALANVGERLPIEPFLAALRDIDPIPGELRAAVRQLGEQLPPEPLLAALRSEQAVIRAVALYLLGSRTPLEAFRTALHDPDAQVRCAAFNQSGKLGEGIPLDLLIEGLHDQDVEVREAAVVAAGRTEVPLEVLVKAAHDRDHRVRTKAREAIFHRLRRFDSLEELSALAHEPGMAGYVLEVARQLHLQLPGELLLCALDDPDHSISDDAVALLAAMGENAPIETLMDILCAPFSRATLGAAKALALLAPYVPVDPILTIIRELDPTEQHYGYLALLLVRSGIPVSKEILTNAVQLEWHVPFGEKDTIVSALEALGERAPIEALLRMLTDDSNCYGWKPGGRAAQVLRNVYEWITPQHLIAAAHHRVADGFLALNVLGVQGKEAPIELFKSVLGDETRDRWLRTEAMHTLHNECGVRFPLRYFLEEAEPGDEWADAIAVETMRELGPEAPIQELLERLISDDAFSEEYLERTSDNDDTVVACALHELAPYLPLEIVVDILGGSNPLARKGAARILGAFGERAPIDKLVALLHNPEERRGIRAAALHSLIELYPYTSAESLIAVLRDKDSDIRKMALIGIMKWGRDIPLEPLLELVADEEYDERDLAIETLGYLQDRAPVDLLVSMLDNEDDFEDAAQALSHMGAYAPLDALIAHVYDKDGDMCLEIIEALAEMGEYAPLELLLQALDDENSEIRQAIIYALDDLAKATPAKFVALAKNDRRPPVREALMQAVARLGKEAPSELALAGLEDEDDDVRFQARAALVELNVDPALIPVELLVRELYAGNGSWVDLALLEKMGARAPVEPILALLGDSNLRMCECAAETLYRTHPEVFAEVARQAEAILRGGATGDVFASRVQGCVADRVRLIGRANAEVLEMVSDLLDWPYWEVRMKAAQALGAVHRSIPDRAIRRLLALRHDPQSKAVREAADEALTEILSRESGMEDE